MTQGLEDYQQQTQRFLHQGGQSLVNPDDIRRYVNRARRYIAIHCQCLRVLTPISGSIISANVTSEGSGYTNPSVVITPPDYPCGLAPYPLGQQATGSASMQAGRITAVQIRFGGSSYFQPQITIVDPTGLGAVVTPNMSFLNATNQGQEVYPFSSIDLAAFPGIGAIYMVKSVSIIYSNYRYSLPMYSFSTYQAKIRQYPFQYQYVPTIGSQFGQGSSGSFYLYPIPSTYYQMEWDCFCMPQDLLDFQSVEVIPQPWDDLIPYYAAHIGFLEMQNQNAARGMLTLFDDMVHRYSAAARPGRVTNPYGRY